jgi:hypothetical protein
MQFHLQAIEIALLRPLVVRVLCFRGPLRNFYDEDFTKVPLSGERNTLFGVYETVCCGAEIVITVGTEFPACPNHPYMKTIWKQIETPAEQVIVLPKKARSEPAA